MAALGRDESAVDGLLGFRATWPPGAADYRAVLDLHDTGLAGVAEALGFEDLLLIDQDGLVVYAANGGRELGADLTADALAQQFDAVSRRLRETTVSRDYLDDVLASMLNAVFTIGRVEPDGVRAAAR